MPLTETFFLLLAGFSVWLWLDSLKTREAGVAAARQACLEEGLQFLDESVHCQSLRLARDGDGLLRLRRVYAFEYSDTGDNRCHGSVTMLGQMVEILHIRPQLYVVPKTSESHDNSD
jgi:Protein of unknown function (DUF3301)